MCYSRPPPPPTGKCATVPPGKCATVDPTDDSYLSVAMHSVLLVKFAAGPNNLKTLKYQSFDQQKLAKIKFLLYLVPMISP